MLPVFCLVAIVCVCECEFVLFECTLIIANGNVSEFLRVCFIDLYLFVLFQNVYIFLHYTYKEHIVYEILRGVEEVTLVVIFEYDYFNTIAGSSLLVFMEFFIFFPRSRTFNIVHDCKNDF